MDMEQGEGKPNICDTCYGAFEYVELYKEHRITCNEAKLGTHLEVYDAELGNVGNELTMFMKVEYAEEKPHICDTCYLVFESEDLCKEHRSTCDKERPVVQMEVDGSLKAGIEGGKQYQCSVCQLIFTSEELWRNHSGNCSEKKLFVCKEEHNNTGNILVVMPHGIIKCESENEGCDAAVVDVKKVPLEGPKEDPKIHDKQCHQCDKCEKKIYLESKFNKALPNTYR